MHTDSACPLCPDNGEVDIVAETKVAYLVEARTSPIEGCFLIVPKGHITNILELPDRWQTDFRALLVSIPWITSTSPYNVSLNMGQAAGQTIPHVHYWVIPRTDKENKSTLGMGLATLLKNVGALSSYIGS